MGSAEFDAWLDQFFAEHQQFITRQMLATGAAYIDLVADAIADELGEYERPTLDAWLRSYIEQYARRHIGLSRANLADALANQEVEPLESVEAVTTGWRENRAESVASDEAVRLNNAVAVTIYASVGIQSVRWVAFGKNCPYCTALNGRVVGINQFFIRVNTDFKPDGADVALRPSSNIRHAPAHRGCDCMVIAS